MQNQRGFTLVELLVTLAIAAILIGLGVPSFKSMIQSNAISSAVNTFLADMRFARSEAIRRGGSVILCRSDNPEASPPKCATGSGDNGWVSGWIIFQDTDTDSKYDDGTDTLLRVQEPIKSMDSIMVGGKTMNAFNFVATGRLANLSSGTVTLTFGGSQYANDLRRTVCVSISGRARVAGDGFASCA